MLGLGAITQITPAGSPTAAAGASVVLLTETGVVTLAGNDVSLDVERRLLTARGTINIWGTARLGQHRTMHLEVGSIRLFGASRTFKSAFFSGEPEVIKVAPEVRDMRVPYEHRDLKIVAKPVEVSVDEPHDTTVPPRLRRT